MYDREDFLLRYLEYAMEKWKGRKFRREKSPELVVANPVVSLVGWRNLEFEVLGFPIDGKATDVELTLDVCDTSGKVLHTFPSGDVVLGEVMKTPVNMLMLAVALVAAKLCAAGIASFADTDAAYGRQSRLSQGAFAGDYGSVGRHAIRSEYWKVDAFGQKVHA